MPIIALIAISLVSWFTLVACASPGVTKRLTDNEKFRVRKDPFYQMMHDEYKKQSKTGKINLLFFGDSITFGWTAQGKAVWDREFTGWTAGNFGVPGETSAGVLWRITHGEVAGLNPKAIVLLIGTNDLSEGTRPAGVIENIGTIVGEFQKMAPEARVIIVGVLPRGPTENLAYRKEIKAINEGLAKFDNGKKIRFLEFNAELLNQENNISEEMMPDYMHLSEKGYEVWANALRPVLSDLSP